ncbi:MAG: type I restriction endonuclease subunit R [Anaerolineales bacterium]|nr:type I restriction endonuclease subunit R [Anaerolineales bacterium]
MSRDKLAESDIELAAIEWLEKLGYSYILGSEIERPIKEVILKDKLLGFLKKQYPHLPQKERDEVYSILTLNQGIDLDHRNRDFHLKLTRGIDYAWKDEKGVEHFDHIYPIDYVVPENNEFLCVNQFPIQGKNNRRPDLIIFVNGIPLVVFEFKNPYELNTTVDNAYNQIEHYIKDIPLLFEYNAITVISDGTETLMGMYSSSREWFSPWKSVDGVQVVENDLALHSLLYGLFPKERLLKYVKNFIFHEDHNGTLIKKGAKYHQFFGVLFALEHTRKAIKPDGDGRIGVIWHTQGAGKSITMAIFTGILRQLPELKNPTILVQVDRRDLDHQLYDNFIYAKDLVGKVSHAGSTDELRKLLATDGGGIIFSTIEKFRLIEDNGQKETEHPILSDRNNIIVIADEAHRTQYGLLDGFAAYLRQALPNASFIGFTGTPVDLKDADTWEVFGETIHVYDIKQSVDDKSTVPIYYEPRLAKLHLANQGIDEEAEEITSELNREDANRAKWAAIDDAAGAYDRVQKVAEDIMEHYLKRTESLPGKAMIVCMSRRNCVRMYDALTKLEGCPEIAVVMTGNISTDPVEWNPHIRTSAQMEAVKSRFKDPDDPLKMVIVRDMWLTGFDAPPVHTMYIDKIMQGHNLMQAIARVNRVFRDKPAGLIVDYIGIGDRLKDATKKYTQGGGRGDVVVDINEAFAQLLEELAKAKELLPEDIDYSNWRALSVGDKQLLVSKSVNHIVKEDETAEKYLNIERRISALATIVKSHQNLQSIALDIIYHQHVGVAVRKIKHPPGAKKKTEEAIKELISRSIESEEVVDVYAMADIEKPDISILNEEFLIGAKEKKSGQALKIEILRQILNNELKNRMSKNIRKYKSLKEKIEEIIANYHKNALDSYSTILELLEQAKILQEEDQRKKELGLSEEELAFYDILAYHKTAIKDYQVITDVVKGVTQAVKKNLQLDWYKKANARAAIRLAVKKQLRNKVKLSELDAILAEIMEQAEGQYKEWPMVG